MFTSQSVDFCEGCYDSWITRPVRSVAIKYLSKNLSLNYIYEPNFYLAVWLLMYVCGCVSVYMSEVRSDLTNQGAGCGFSSVYFVRARLLGGRLYLVLGGQSAAALSLRQIK